MKITDFRLCCTVHEIFMSGHDKPTINKTMEVLNKISGVAGVSDDDTPSILVSVDPGINFKDIVKQANEILEG